MKKFILFAIFAMLAISGFTQTKPSKPSAAKVVPVYLVQKHDTIKELNILHVDTFGVVHRNKGFELIDGLYSPQTNRYVTVKDGDVFVLDRYIPTLAHRVEKDNILNITPIVQESATPAPVKTVTNKTGSQSKPNTATKSAN